MATRETLRSARTIPLNGGPRPRPRNEARAAPPPARPTAEGIRRLFGTDGVRGVANVYPMTTEMAMQIGRAAAYIFKNGHQRHRIVIGKDTRLSVQTGLNKRH